MSAPSSAMSIDHFANVACKHGLWSTPARLRWYCGYVFSDVPIEGARALDVGGGSGVFSLYMAAAGAREVVCLEPGAAGSREGATQRFDAVRAELGGPAVSLLPAVLQEFDPGESEFDIILLHNSVNHLDEQACIELRRDPEARAIYSRLFKRLAAMLAARGHLILTDGTPANLWPQLGLRNPFAPTIEWHKHQPPEVWRGLGEEAGLGFCCLKWTSPSSLGAPGRLLLGHRLGAYLTLGAFRLHMRKP